jgi:hypothetical protein
MANKALVGQNLTDLIGLFRNQWVAKRGVPLNPQSARWGADMNYVLMIVLTSIGAILFDWALHFQTQMFMGITCEGNPPKRYQLGPKRKIFLMLLYVISLNLTIVFGKNERFYLLITTLVLFVFYALVSFYYSSSKD